MFDVQNSASETSERVPIHQRYCCMKRLRGSTGQTPIAKLSGTYLILHMYAKHGGGTISCLTNVRWRVDEEAGAFRVVINFTRDRNLRESGRATPQRSHVHIPSNVSHTSSVTVTFIASCVFVLFNAVIHVWYEYHGLVLWGGWFSNASRT